jgi:pilus assembly protein Flp/PilA
MLRNLCKNTAGATAIEYGLIASVISVAAIGAFIALGGSANATFSKVNTAYEQVN